MRADEDGQSGSVTTGTVDARQGLDLLRRYRGWLAETTAMMVGVWLELPEVAYADDGSGAVLWPTPDGAEPPVHGGAWNARRAQASGLIAGAQADGRVGAARVERGRRRASQRNPPPTP